MAGRGPVPSPAELMLARGGAALADSADASRCYPDLWPSPAAARQAFHRARRVTGPAADAPGAPCHAPLRQATYQRSGAGRRPAFLVFDPAVVPPDKLRGWLEERVGPLARFELDPQPPPSDPTPPVEAVRTPPAAVSGSGGFETPRRRPPRRLLERLSRFLCRPRGRRRRTNCRRSSACGSGCGWPPWSSACGTPGRSGSTACGNWTGLSGRQRRGRRRTCPPASGRRGGPGSEGRRPLGPRARPPGRWPRTRTDDRSRASPSRSFQYCPRARVSAGASRRDIPPRCDRPETTPATTAGPASAARRELERVAISERLPRAFVGAHEPPGAGLSTGRRWLSAPPCAFPPSRYRRTTLERPPWLGKRAVDAGPPCMRLTGGSST